MKRIASSRKGVTMQRSRNPLYAARRVGKGVARIVRNVGLSCRIRYVLPLGLEIGTFGGGKVSERFGIKLHRCFLWPDKQ